MSADLEKRIAELERKVEFLVKQVCPDMPRTKAEIFAEVQHLVRTLGPDKAAEEINRRNSLRTN